MGFGRPVHCLTFGIGNPLDFVQHKATESALFSIVPGHGHLVPVPAGLWYPVNCPGQTKRHVRVMLLGHHDLIANSERVSSLVLVDFISSILYFASFSKKLFIYLCILSYIYNDVFIF